MSGRDDNQQKLSAEELRTIALTDYFGLISEEIIDQTLAFFHEGATFTLFPSGRTFSGHTEIASMYRSVFESHGAIDREVVDVIIDEDAQRIAASFIARPSDAPTMYNVNIWQFRGSKFESVKVFTSNPAL